MSAAIVGGLRLHALLPMRLPIGDPPAGGGGRTMVAGGIGLAAWAVASAGDADVERESELVTDGPYAVTRNPMYVGWSAGVLGLAMASRSAWMLIAWAVAVRALDREIEAEEARLRERFGASYPRTGAGCLATSSGALHRADLDEVSGRLADALGAPLSADISLTIYFLKELAPIPRGHINRSVDAAGERAG